MRCCRVLKTIFKRAAVTGFLQNKGNMGEQILETFLNYSTVSVFDDRQKNIQFGIYISPESS